MYDRRPASRAARGTPTVAVGLTPVVRGSFHSAISSPLRGGKCPPLASCNISWMLDWTSSKSGQSMLKGDYRGGLTTRCTYILLRHGQENDTPRSHHRDRVGKCD